MIDPKSSIFHRPQGMMEEQFSPQVSAVNNMRPLLEKLADVIHHLDNIANDESYEAVSLLSEARDLHQQHYDELTKVASRFMDEDWAVNDTEREATTIRAMCDEEGALSALYEDTLNGRAFAHDALDWHDVVARQHETQRELMQRIEVYCNDNA